MKKLALIGLLILLIATFPASTASRKCGISERVVLESTTDISVWHTFTRGAHQGFVILSPGQTVTVDVVWCE